MFDYHMHTRVSFDGHDTGLQMALAAKEAGLKEICFTDHLDYDPLGKMGILAFDTAIYNADISLLATTSCTYAGLLQCSFYCCSLRKIQFAAKCIINSFLILEYSFINHRFISKNQFAKLVSFFELSGIYCHKIIIR